GLALALGVELQAEEVLDVEDVDGLVAVGGDDRRGDRDVVCGERPGEVVEEAGTVAGLDLDDRVDVRAGVVEGDAGREDAVALAPLDLVLVVERLAGDDLAGEDADDAATQAGEPMLLVGLALD